MSKPTFGKVFLDRLDQITSEAIEAGINMSVICREAEISRATPDRWRRKLPKTVEILDRMEKVLEEQAQPRRRKEK